ncbi:MAG: zinc-binding dehydrogenase, partial [Pseudomonadota bacterium]
VVIDVAATSLNYLDVVQRNGWFTLPGYQLPHIAGMDVTGVVAEVGSEVSRVKVGDRVVVDPSMVGAPAGSKLSGDYDIYGEIGVIGATLPGGYAEKCLAPETHLYPVPDGMSWREAVVFPTAWMTAHHALFDVGELKAGETLLIHAAGSGLSMAGIQWAKNAGATVLATAGSEEKCQKALDLGADKACNNRETDVAAWAREATGGRGVDMVFDHVGTALWAKSLFALRPRGRLVNCGNTSGDAAEIPSLGYMYHQGLRIMGSDPYRYEEFGPAWRTYCDGDFNAEIDSTFPMSEGAAAHEKMQNGRFFGKIILEP